MRTHNEIKMCIYALIRDVLRDHRTSDDIAGRIHKTLLEEGNLKLPINDGHSFIKFQDDDTCKECGKHVSDNVHRI